MLEDLDPAAEAVYRLGKKCNDFELNRFDMACVNLKLGIVDSRKLEHGSRLNEKGCENGKMLILISATSRLHTTLEALTELEITEQKMRQGKNKKMHFRKLNFDPFSEKLVNQLKMVHHFQGISLWCKTFDKSVGLMARIVSVVYVRICAVLGRYIPNLTSFSFQNMGCFKDQTDTPMIEPVKEHFTSHSGPITMASKATLVRFHSQKSDLFFNEQESVLSIENISKKSLFHSAGPLTLGGSGLALRYANVILLAEMYLDPTESIDHMDRESLYQMLLENLKVLVRTELSKNMKCAEDYFLLAMGWSEAMNEMLGWLAPVARNTVKWQMERSFEKIKFDSKPSVLLLHTLHFSDKERKKHNNLNN